MRLPSRQAPAGDDRPGYPQFNNLKTYCGIDIINANLR